MLLPALVVMASGTTDAPQSVIDAITAQMQRCWNIPAEISEDELSKPTIFQVDVSKDGRIVSVRRVGPAVETTLVKSAEKAIYSCGPYLVPSAGTYTITFDATDTF